MTYYQALIEKDDNSCFGVSFPEFETVFSAGDTFEEAILSASEALQLYFEDDIGNIPDPISPDILLARTDVKADISNGAVMTAIQYIAMGSRTVRANVTFDASLLEAIDSNARERKVSRAAWLASAARKQLNIV
ncbi:MAG: type II toxin-antitoxin system HicB family antitoxin [Cohaesibacteraceae bacterium]|nr:type II toxin-antitoxin system HicB family antitoxin [Cohaesibacteraceae bacterium]